MGSSTFTTLTDPISCLCYAYLWFTVHIYVFSPLKLISVHGKAASCTSKLLGFNLVYGL